MYYFHVQYVVILDVDILIIDIHRKLQDIIQHANENYAETKYGGCHFIAQDSPTTINTGFLIFKVSAFSDYIISKWVSNHFSHRSVIDVWVELDKF